MLLLVYCNCIVTRGGVYDEISPRAEPEGFSYVPRHSDHSKFTVVEENVSILTINKKNPKWSKKNPLPVLTLFFLDSALSQTSKHFFFI